MERPFELPAESPFASRAGFWISILLALIVAIIYIHELRDGHDWGGDFSLYISHARNISEGKPYAQTGYIVNPYFRRVSPDTYPPLFPLLLAPIYGRYGLDFKALKIPGVLFFSAGIPVLFLLFRKDLSTLQALLAVGLWAAWPFILWYKDSVLPDLVFVFLWVLGLWLIRLAYDELAYDKAVKQPMALAISIGLVSYAAYATRTPGVLLPATVVAFEVLRFRRITRVGIAACAVFGVLALGQNLLIHNETSYFQMFSFEFVETGKATLHSLTTLFSSAESGPLRLARYAATFAAILLAGAGYWMSARRFRSPADIAVAMYVALLLIWPGAGTRYILPIIPFLFFYMVAGLDGIRLRFGARLGYTLEAAFMALVLVCYASEDSQFKPTRIEGGISTPGFAQLVEYIDAHTKPSDIFVFYNPRVLALFARRPSSVYPKGADPDLTWRYSHTIHARYLVVADCLPEDEALLHPFLKKYGDHLQALFSNSNFHLYEIED